MLESWHIQRSENMLNRDQGSLPEVYTVLLDWNIPFSDISHLPVLSCTLSEHIHTSLPPPPPPFILVMSKVQSINQPMDSISYAGGCPYTNYDRYTLYIDSYVVLMCHCLKLSIHFFLGLPLPLLPSISASYTLLTSLSGPISARASLQLTCLLLTFSNTPSCLSSSLMSTFLALSTLLFPAIRLNTLISVACIADSWCLFSTHVSLPYTSMGTTMALYTFIFVFLLNSFCFHTGSFNTPITLAAFPILLLISSSILPSPLIMIPKYFATSTDPNFLSPTATQQCPLSLPTFITSVFSQFIFISHFVNVSSNFFKFTCRDSSLSATNTMSSAKSRTSTVSFPSLTPSLKPFLASFTILSRNTLNSHGERVHPCLTPWSTLNHSECFSPTFTLASHSMYRDFTALTSPSPTCACLNASHIFILFTLSYAFSKSINATNISLLFSITFSITCLKVNTWYTQLLFALNPTCSSITLPSVLSLNLVFKTLPNHFPATLNRLIPL